MRRRARAAVTLATLAAVLIAPSASGAAAPPHCSGLALSPDFSRTRTVLCAVEPEPDAAAPTQTSIQIWLSRDAGRTWSLRRGAGLVVAPRTEAFNGGRLSGVLFSGRYAEDRAMYVAIEDQGLLASTDDGDTWRNVDPLAVGRRETVMFTPYVDGETLRANDQVLAPVAFHAGFVQTTTRETSGAPETKNLAPPSARILPPVHQVADVPPVFALQMAFPPTNGEDLPGLFTGYESRPRVDDAPEMILERTVTYLYGCAYDLACPELRHTFPEGELVNTYASPDYARDATIFAIGYRFGAFGQLDFDFTSRVSRDGGRTFVRWADLERHLAPIRATGARPSVLLASDPARRSRLVARVLALRVAPRVPRASDPPDEQFFVSDDLGRTWRRTGWRRIQSRGRSTGTLPWGPGREPGTATDKSLAIFAMAADGRLFMQLHSPDGQPFRQQNPPGTYCSVDGGLRWRWPCAR